MTEWLTDTEQAAWRAYIEGSLRLNARIEADLQAAAGLTLAEYQLLVHLSEAPAGRIRLRELARRLVFSPSRLTYQLARMEQAGLLRREPCESDRRGSYAAITARGLAALRDAAPAHVASVRAHLLDPLGAQDVRDLDRIFGALRAHPASGDDEPAARADGCCGSGGRPAHPGP